MRAFAADAALAARATPQSSTRHRVPRARFRARARGHDGERKV
jgi:hypothetical protein